MIRASNMWLFVCVIILAYSVRVGEFRGIGVDKREFKTGTSTECNWFPPNQQFWNGQGCRVCSDCSLVNLYTKRECGRRNDAECEERCIDKDAVFNKVTQQCDPPQRYAVFTPTHPQSTTGIRGSLSTKHVVKLETAGPRQENYKTLLVVILSIALILVLIAMVIIIIWIIKNRRCLKKKSAERTSVMGENVPMNNMAERPLPPVPVEGTKRKECVSSQDPRSDLTDTKYSEGVLYTRPRN